MENFTTKEIEVMLQSLKFFRSMISIAKDEVDMESFIHRIYKVLEDREIQEAMKPVEDFSGATEGDR